MIQNINVQFPLMGKAGLGKVTAPQVADSWVDGVRPEQQVELGMKRMPEEEFDDNLFLLDLLRQSAETCFILIRRRAECYPQCVGSNQAQHDRLSLPVRILSVPPCRLPHCCDKKNAISLRA